MDKDRIINFQAVETVKANFKDAEPEATLIITSETIASRPMLTVSDKVTGETFTIPADMTQWIVQGRGAVFSKFLVQRETEQLQTNDPSRLANLVQHSGVRTLRLAEHQLKDESTPYISWVKPVISLRGVETAPPRWELRLVGAPEVVLNAVAWDNAEGIAQMVEAMKDPEALLALLGLTNQVVSERLASRRAAVAFKALRNVPKVTLPPMREFLEANGLQSYTGEKTGWYSGKVGMLTVKAEGKQIPVAVMIKPPSYPAFAKELHAIKPSDVLQKDWSVNIARAKEEAKVEWRRRFDAAISKTDWRIVEIASPTGRNMGTYKSELIIITRIPQATWTSIGTAVSLAFLNARDPIVKF